MIRFLTLTLSVLACVAVGSAQTKAKSSAKSAGCSVAGIAFKCPKGFEIKNSRDADAPFMAFQTAGRIAIFAFSPEEVMTEDEIIQFSLSKSFKRMFGSNFDELKVKDSNDFSDGDKWSKFEISKFAKVGLDEKRNTAFHFQYVRLKLKNKEVVAGFIYDSEASNAADWYSGWSGGGLEMPVMHYKI